MSLIRIIAVVVDETKLTVYKPDSSSFEVPQGDPRVFTLLDALPRIEQHGFAMVELGRDNPYKDFEKKSGFVRFFKVAKEKVAHIFGGREPIAPVGITGKIPDTGVPEERTYTHAEAVADIMAHATPVASENFDPQVADNDTIVAVTDEAIIPHAENMADQLRHGAKTGSTKGLENFYQRIGRVIKNRGHSVQDLLRFMEKNDLPIADDGSLIVYKVLRKKGNTYYDCHTQKVPQHIGSFVHMDEKLVDPNRSQECSNGLHVARRGYIGGFHGDVCTIVKVAPEDVIAVPHRDANKVRVCGYHVLMELDSDAWQKLKNNRPMTDNPKCQRMLGRAISGDHVAVLEYVKIGGEMGTNITVIPAEKVQKAEKPTEVRKAVSVDDKSIKKPENISEVDKKEVAQKMTSVVKTTNTRQQKAQELFQAVESATNDTDRFAAALELLQLKRTSKVSWDSLGIRNDDAKRILDISIESQVRKAVESKAVSEPETHTAHVMDQGTEVTVSTDTPTPEIVAQQTPAKPVTAKARMYALYKVYVESLDHQHIAAASRELLELRKRIKKSWASLGYPKLTDQLLNNSIARASFAPQQASAIPPATERAIKATKAAGEVAKAKKAAKTAKAPTALTGSRKEVARTLFNSKRWADLAAFKRKAKISWSELGFSQAEVNEIKLHSGG